MPNRTNLHILTFILAVLLTGCSIMEHGDNPCTDTDDSEFINISFRLVTSPTASARTNEESQYDEMESEWPELEDCIYSDDFAFFIYALYDYEDDYKEIFIMMVDNMTLLTDPHTNISGGPSNYTLKVSIPRTVFENVVPAGVEHIKLRIDAFANNTNKILSGVNPPKDNTFREMGEAASEWKKYSIFDCIYKGTGGIKSGARIPMFGTVTIEVTREQLYKSRPYAPIWGDDMHMLRSLAKIKVIDNYSNPDGETSAPYIATVTFKSSTNNAYILPNNALNYVNGEQVTSPNPCSGEQTTITLLKQDNSWIGYIPEQNITEDIGFTIKINYSDSETKDFFVPMTEYDGQKLDFGDAILRNHIYTLSVNIAEDEIEASIKAKVEPWSTEPPLNLDYTKTVYVAPEGKLLWDDGTCQSNSNGKVIMKEWTSRVITDEDGVDKIVKDPVPLEGKFLIQTPEGATWTAYLIPISGQYGDAFAFQDIDENGNYITESDGKPRLVSSVSGRIKEFSIDGTQTPEFSNLRIYTLQDKPESNVANRAYLQVVVTIENGGMTSVVEAPVNPDGITRYEIIQNP